MFNFFIKLLHVLAVACSAMSGIVTSMFIYVVIYDPRVNVMDDIYKISAIWILVVSVIALLEKFILKHTLKYIAVLFSYGLVFGSIVSYGVHLEYSPDVFVYTLFYYYIIVMFYTHGMVVKFLFFRER